MKNRREGEKGRGRVGEDEKLSGGSKKFVVGNRNL